MILLIGWICVIVEFVFIYIGEGTAAGFMAVVAIVLFCTQHIINRIDKLRNND